MREFRDFLYIPFSPPSSLPILVKQQNDRPNKVILMRWHPSSLSLGYESGNVVPSGLIKVIVRKREQTASHYVQDGLCFIETIHT